jgi:uncharacterized protein (DUF58 family)
VGLAVLGALVLVALLAPDTDNNATYQILPLLLFLLVVAVGSSWSFKARFAATRLLPRFGTAGYPLNYRILVALERAERRALRSFRVSESQRARPFRLATVKEVAAPPVAPNEEVEVPVVLTPPRRGVLRFTGVTLARPDPLGLVRAVATVPLPQSVLILPRRYPVASIALPGTAKYQEGGVALASSVGQSDEYVALRDYRHGDPLRHIHWRSWARVGHPVVKEFEDEFFVRHALVLDTFTDPMHSDVF